MRIAMLSVHSCPVGSLGARDTGGMSVYIRELARALGGQGHSVDIYTRLHDLTETQVTELGRQVQLIHLRAGEEAAMNKLAVYSYLPDFACHLEGFRKNHDLRYDLVFSHYWLSGWVGQYLQQWWHVPHVIMFHTLGAAKNALGIGEDEPELRLSTERDLARNCHRIIASTRGGRDNLVRYCGAAPEKISVIPCGVNLELFQPVDREMARRKLGLVGDRIMLFVGRIEPLKGIEPLLRAMPHLRNIKGLRLVVIGGDAYSRQEIERLEKLSGELRISNSVSFLGRVEHENLPYYYSAADVCVIPSYYESFGMVALEALACGTPVVANNVGYLSGVIREGETGYVVADNAPRRLARRIYRLLSDPDHRMNPAPAIRASVSRFGWPHIADAIIGEFRRVLAGQLAGVS